MSTPVLRAILGPSAELTALVLGNAYPAKHGDSFQHVVTTGWRENTREVLDRHIAEVVRVAIFGFYAKDGHMWLRSPLIAAVVAGTEGLMQLAATAGKVPRDFHLEHSPSVWFQEGHYANSGQVEYKSEFRVVVDSWVV